MFQLIIKPDCYFECNIVILGANCLRGNYTGKKLSERQLSGRGEQLSRGKYLQDNLLGGKSSDSNNPGKKTIIQGAIFWGTTFIEDKIPGAIIQGGNFSQGQSSGQQFIWFWFIWSWSFIEMLIKTNLQKILTRNV